MWDRSGWDFVFAALPCPAGVPSEHLQLLGPGWCGTAWPGSSAQALPSLPPAWTGTALGQPGFTITLQFVLYVFHFSSTEGESWILMKRMIINTTVRLPNNSLENAVSRQKARSENVYAS